MPPTLAAAIKIKSGFLFFKNFNTLFWSIKLSLFLVAVIKILSPQLKTNFILVY